MLQEKVLALLLDCGTDDLSMLNDMKIDFEKVIDECKYYNNLTLRGLVETAWDMAFAEFKEAVERDLPEIQERIAAYAILDDDGSKDLPPEIADVPDVYRYGYMDVENFSDPAKRDLEELKEISLDDDFEFSFNCSSSRICLLDHHELYSRLFNDLLDGLEEQMGISISNRVNIYTI